MNDAISNTERRTKRLVCYWRSSPLTVFFVLVVLCVKVGSDIVWSSNESCDHHFHANCIEKWLMKQREGPLCPCCRRDFIVDPFDLLEEEGDDNRGETGALPVFQWDPTYLELNRSSPENVNDNNNNNNNNNNLNGAIVVTAPGDDATNTRSAADGVATTGVDVSNGGGTEIHVGRC